jgi:hypothetical protein
LVFTSARSDDETDGEEEADEEDAGEEAAKQEQKPRLFAVQRRLQALFSLPAAARRRREVPRPLLGFE